MSVRLALPARARYVRRWLAFEPDRSRPPAGRRSIATWWMDKMRDRRFVIGFSVDGRWFVWTVDGEGNLLDTATPGGADTVADAKRIAGRTISALRAEHLPPLRAPVSDGPVMCSGCGSVMDDGNGLVWEAHPLLHGIGAVHFAHDEACARIADEIDRQRTETDG